MSKNLPKTAMDAGEPGHGPRPQPMMRPSGASLIGATWLINVMVRSEAATLQIDSQPRRFASNPHLFQVSRESRGNEILIL
jgi:hypothetical protein